MKILVFVVLIWTHFLNATAAVTYTFSGGRLGDNLLAYCHAQWIAYTYDIPLLYKPFDYSDQLHLHQVSMCHTPELEQQFDAVVIYDKNTHIDVESNILYVIPYFSESIFNRYDNIFPYLFNTDWKDPLFKTILQTMIHPIKNVPKVEIPSGCVSIALHMRKGTGWDIPNYHITPDAPDCFTSAAVCARFFFYYSIEKISKTFLSNAALCTSFY